MNTKVEEQCRSLSPGTHWRCEGKKGHIKRARKNGHVPRHRAAWAKWTDEEGTKLPKGQEHYQLTRPVAPEFAEVKFNNIEGDLVPLAAEEQLRQWWFTKANDEIELTVPKAVEYGSTDLIDIGLMLSRTMRRNVSEEEAAELGVFFYLIGKIARWQSAIERGERPSDDTLLDIGVYVRMAQRIRHSGGWPGTKDET